MSQYDTIGFTGITSKETLSALINQVLPHAQKVGNYAVYRDASGAELWVGINQDNEFFSAEPYFSGCLNAQPVSAATSRAMPLMLKQSARLGVIFSVNSVSSKSK